MLKVRYYYDGAFSFSAVIFTYIALLNTKCIAAYFHIIESLIIILSHIYISASFVNNFLITHTFFKEGVDFHLNSIGVNF